MRVVEVVGVGVGMKVGVKVGVEGGRRWSEDEKGG